jgi:hypothetical protein
VARFWQKTALDARDSYGQTTFSLLKTCNNMALSLFARRAVLCGSLAGFCTALLTAHAAYLPFGNEAVLPGTLPGDQAHPHVSVNAKGGFLVWQDNATDGDGTGIRALGLDSSFSPVQAPFRVNYDARNDQESPQVALLSGGGAAFFWKGGPLGAQRLYARFLSESNTWLTGDVLISSSSNHVKTPPSLAPLANGNLLVVWASSNQRGTDSMQDVYAQILAPSGQKTTPAFAVNQFTAYNQRNPTAAALPNGGFVIAWISERQRKQSEWTTNEVMYTGMLRESVDVYARSYNANANPLANEFLVNTNLVICASPSIAAASDGGFVVSWSQGDPRNLGNTWDIYARAFTSIGLGGATERVNDFTDGTQFASRMAVINDEYLVVWTSAMQDGSYQGVYGQYLNRSAKPTGAEFRVNSNVVLNQNQPAVASDNDMRFVAVWKTSSVQGHFSEELCAQVFAPPGYAPAPVTTNYAGPEFVGPPVTGGNGGSDIVSSLPSIPFPVAPSGSLEEKSFSYAKGSYYGLVYNKFGVNSLDSGYVTATVDAKRGYSLKVRIAGKTYSLAGKLNSEGQMSRQISKGSGKGKISVAMGVDLSGGNQLRGTWTDGASQCEFLADRRRYSKNVPCPEAGSYTVFISAPDSDDVAPGGYAYGTLKVNRDGSTSLSAKLADGTVVTHGSCISKQGILPLYASPYGNKGLVLSWVSVLDKLPSAEVIWIKPQNKAKYYPLGFAGISQLSGSVYKKPAAKSKLLGLNSGFLELSFSGGELTAPLSAVITFDAKHRVIASGAGAVKMTVTPQTGLFTGTFVNPANSKRVSFSGRLLQPENPGAGFFLNQNASGQVLLSHPSAP